MKDELKYKVLEAITSEHDLFQFEKWLYTQKQLVDSQIDDSIVYDLFSFNYKNKDALYRFEKLLSKYFTEDEINFAYVKNLLKKLIEEKSIEYPQLSAFLNEINSYSFSDNSSNTLNMFGRYEYELEYGNLGIKEIESDMLKDAAEIYQRMVNSENSGVNQLSEFLKSDDFYSKKMKEIEVFEVKAEERKGKWIIWILITFIIILKVILVKLSIN